jgi:uncharacterized repeat protein (TIGR03803 family)
MRSTHLQTFLTAFVVLALALFPSSSALGQTTSMLYSFTGGSDGDGPSRPLVFDSAGNLYGTAFAGGIATSQGGNGVVFELSPLGEGQWTETVLYSFAGGSDGYWASSGVIFDAVGNLYGTTEYGGANGDGTVYELSPASGGGWTHTVLYSFAGGHDGAFPGSVIFDSAGNLYGTTQADGAYKRGTAFELSPVTGGGWTETVLLSLPDTPSGPLVIDQNGTLYGTTQAGGSASQGSVYRLRQTSGGWRFNTLYSFLGGTDGSNPEGGVILVAAHLYGVTMQGGSVGTGTFYELTPVAGVGWSETQVYSFGSRKADPIYPTATVTTQGERTFWGASAAGGTSGCGGIFKLSLGSSGWQERNVYDSNCVGSGPLGVAAVDSAGDLFGVGAGGIYGAGDIYELVR